MIAAGVITERGDVTALAPGAPGKPVFRIGSGKLMRFAGSDMEHAEQAERMRAAKKERAL
jgi:hypothetical protein